jgi:hypothetical protein
VIPARWARRVGVLFTGRMCSSSSDTVSTVRRSHDRLALAGQKLWPGWPRPPRGPIDGRVAQDRPYCRGRQLMADTDQFAVDTPITPRRVLPSHAATSRPPSAGPEMAARAEHGSLGVGKVRAGRPVDANTASSWRRTRISSSSTARNRNTVKLQGAAGQSGSFQATSRDSEPVGATTFTLT